MTHGSFSKGKSNTTVSKEEHLAWFSKTLANPQREIFIILVDHQPAGALFFFSEHDPATISLYLLRPFTGRQLGPAIIKHGCLSLFQRRREVKTIAAEILDANPPSLHAFKKAGFSETEQKSKDTVVLHFARPTPPHRIPHNRPSHDQAESVAAHSAAASGHWVNGPWTAALENRLTQLAGEKWTTTSSGFAALKLALQALNVGKGDEVIVPAYSCVALPNAVLSLGAEPVPVDINKDFNISPEACEQALTEKTVAIIAVNTFGSSADITNLQSFGRPVVEDGSHGFPYSENQWQVRGDLAILSFYATKMFGCGQGGAIMTRNQEHLETITDLISYTDKPPSPARDNLSMSEMESAIAYRQLDKQNFFFTSRKALADLYLEKLSNYSQQPSGLYYRFTITLPNEEILLSLQEHLSQNGITAERPVELWNPIPSAIEAYQTTLSLPLFPDLPQCDVITTRDLITEFLSHV